MSSGQVELDVLLRHLRCLESSWIKRFDLRRGLENNFSLHQLSLRFRPGGRQKFCRQTPVLDNWSPNLWQLEQFSWLQALIYLAKK